MNTVEVKIKDLKFAKYNPRMIKADEFEKLKKSIETFGMVEPIVVNKGNAIIGGHQRVRAAEALKQTHVPCFFVDLSDTEEKKLNLALNKIQGEWDNEKLSELIHSLDDIKLTGFDEIELKFIEDIAGFGTGGALEDDEFKDHEPGELEDQRLKLTFYYDDASEYEKMHKFFGGKSFHDKNKLKELVAMYEAKR